MNRPRDKIYCGSWQLFALDSDETPVGFIPPVYRIIAPDGVERNINADRMQDALDRLFEESA